LAYNEANADMEERREEREESLALMQATNWTWMYRQWWVHTINECEED